MAKKKRTIPREVSRELDAFHRDSMRRLEARIAYHRAKLAEEQAKKAS